MPQAIPFIAKSAGAFISLIGKGAIVQALTTTAVGGLFVNVGLAAASAALAGKPKTLAGQDPGAQLRFGPNPNAARSFVYGETAVAGQLIYQGATGDDNKFLHMILALADGGENEGVQSVQFDDESLTLDGSDFITSPSKWAQKARVQYNTGHPSTQTAFSDAVSEVTEWTAANKGLGTALAYIRLEYDPEAFQSVPNPKFIVRGRKVYDPRLDTSDGANPDNATYWAWTQNPALWALDYLRGIKSGGTTGDRMGGLGVGNDLIDWSSWADAADVCDENVTVNAGGTIDRYTGGGGVVSSDDEPLAVLEAMAATFAGSITTRSGKVACYAGETQTATVTLTDDDLAGPIQVSTAVSIRETANAVSAQYREPSIGYEQQTAPPYRNSAWETEDDSEVLWTQLDLQFVDDHRRAQWLAKIHGGNLREPRQLTAKYKIKAIQILEGEVFTLDSDSYGAGVNGKFRLLQKTINVDGTVDIVAKSETDSKYDWTAATDEQAAPTGTLVTSDTPTPATPSGWTVTPSDIAGPQGSTVTVLDIVSPGSLPTSTDLVEFQIQRQAGPTLGLDMLGGQFSSASSGAAADASYQTVASLSLAQADQGLRIPNIERSRNYSTRVRYRNKFGAAGSWQTISSAVAAAGAATSAPSGWSAASGTITSAEGHTRPVLAVTAPTVGVPEEASQVSIDARKVTETDFSAQQVMTRADASRGVNIAAEPGVDYIVRVRYGASAESWGPDQQIPVSATATTSLTISGFSLASNSSESGAYSVPGFKASWTALTGDDLQRARNIEIQYHVTADSSDVTTIYAEPEESSKTVHGLLAGVEYTVRMRASDIFSAGAWTSTDTVTVSATWTTGLATSVEWASVLDDGGTIPADNATVGAAWGSNLTGRPTELTDGRVSSGLNSSGVLKTNVPNSQVTGLGALATLSEVDTAQIAADAVTAREIEDAAIGDDQIASSRLLTVEASSYPTATSARIIYDSTNKEFYADDAASIFKLTPHLFTDTLASNTTFNNTGEPYVVCRVDLTNMNETSLIWPTSVGVSMPTGTNAADTAAIKATWSIWIGDTTVAVNNPISDSTNEREIWVGATNGLTFTDIGGGLIQPDLNDLNDALVGKIGAGAFPHALAASSTFLFLGLEITTSTGNIYLTTSTTNMKAMVTG